MISCFSLIFATFRATSRIQLQVALALRFSSRVPIVRNLIWGLLVRQYVNRVGGSGVDLLARSRKQAAKLVLPRVSRIRHAERLCLLHEPSGSGRKRRDRLIHLVQALLSGGHAGLPRSFRFRALHLRFRLVHRMLRFVQLVVRGDQLVRELADKRVVLVQPRSQDFVCRQPRFHQVQRSANLKRSSKCCRLLQRFPARLAVLPVTPFSRRLRAHCAPQLSKRLAQLCQQQLASFVCRGVC
mmetsp:Transcript_399/g.779  ORF Transcript_399/g.779 Transcript_399/m.779 type:complete len:241 (+) Transcript_399:83-805(+)